MRSLVFPRRDGPRFSDIYARISFGFMFGEYYDHEDIVVGLKWLLCGRVTATGKRASR